MSDIIVHEEQILKAEETRVTLRNNLRNQGVECADDETIDSLANKVMNIQSYNKMINKSMDGDVYDNTINTISASQYFQYNVNIKSISLLKLSKVISNAFQDCNNVKYIYLPQCYEIQLYNCLGGCGSLILPRLSSLGNSAMGGNNKTAKVIDFGLLSNSTGWQVSNSPSLRYFILRKTDAIATLSATSVFNGTPFATGGGKCFVPNALISNYESGTNWSALAGTTFISIEGSRFEELDWFESYNSKCTLDGGEIEVLDNETVAIFKHTENISHVYEDGVELSDTDLVKDRTLTTTI